MTGKTLILKRTFFFYFTFSGRFNGQSLKIFDFFFPWSILMDLFSLVSFCRVTMTCTQTYCWELLQELHIYRSLPNSLFIWLEDDSWVRSAALKTWQDVLHIPFVLRTFFRTCVTSPKSSSLTNAPGVATSTACMALQCLLGHVVPK